MKIAILTLPIHGNYGGCLQNYALNCILRNNGFQSFTIDYKIQKHQRVKSAVFRVIRMFGFGYFMKWISFLNPKFAFLYYLRDFADKHIPLSKVYKTKAELEELSNNLDAVIVGSDQVWRYIFIYDDVDTYFLDFVKNTNTARIAYAASLGVDYNEFPDRELERIRCLYTKFDAVSVREKSAVKLIKKYWNGDNAEHVLDPTMLLPASTYREIYKTADIGILPEKNMFYYILDINTKKRCFIDELAKEKSLLPYTIYSNNRKDLKNFIKKGFSSKIEQWLACFDCADYVITDSFHGCVFCILFNKQFFVLVNRERGLDRFKSLLGQFDLESRMIDDPERIDVTTLSSIPDIDYEIVNSILEEEREKSISFLKKNLS